ncbi:MAG: PKD domain-containing protein [Bacteroidota bacterium]
MVRKLLVAIVIFICHHQLFAQKINVPLIECLGNVTGMSYTPPTGLTLSSVSWDFGDGSNTSGSSVNHTYASKGFYTIIVNATFTNSTSRIDSQKIEVVGLPNINFYYNINTSDTCYNNNNVCFVDTSTAASAGQNLTRRLFIWGDGTFVNAFPPNYGDELCHKYAVSNVYTVQMEITDKLGCKNTMTKTIRVVDNIDPDFTLVNEFVDCSTKKVCLLNVSKGNNGSAKFKWQIDTAAIDTNKYLSSKKCVYYNGSRPKVAAMLSVISEKGCRDTIIDSFSVKLEPMPTSITLEDRKLCYSTDGVTTVSVTPVTHDGQYWIVNNLILPPKQPHPATIGYVPKEVGALPGINTVSVTIKRGSCTKIIADTFRVMGPVLGVKIIDDMQCFSNRQVYMYDNSRYVNRSSAKYKWVLEDVNGGNCTANVINGINPYMNCNTSLDWFIKHKYTTPLATYRYSFIITDTVNGCTATVKDSIKMKYCSPLLSIDTVNICQNKLFMENAGSPLPKYFKIDAGKWQNFPDYPDTSLVGMHDMGLIFETIVTPWAENIGNDSLRIHNDTMVYYDTVYKKQFLNIHKLIDDTLSIKIHGKCKPFRGTVYFKKGDFKPGETIMINWGDSGNVIQKITSFTHIDSISHLYNRIGVQTNVRVVLFNSLGCEKTHLFDLATGHTSSVISNKYDCIQNKVCFSPFIFDFRKGIYWPNNTQYDNVRWEFDDTTGPITDFLACYKFKQPGKRKYKMIVNDSYGCKDTLRDSIFIQDLRVNVKAESRKIYCSELKQFFDSSSYIADSTDKIKQHAWDFGTGVFSVFQKDPLLAFNTSVDKINVRYVVTTEQGCTDTVKYILEFIGPKPYFTIKDTIGCGSLLAKFNNLSKNCKSYIWEFGDSLNTTINLNDHQTTTFNYTKPGRYLIKLTGFDTVYNPITGSTVFCKNVFPDNIFQKDSIRAVLVLPKRTTGILGDDTICLGSPIVLSSLTDKAYQMDYWNMGDSVTYDRSTTPSIIAHLYKKAGNYTVLLTPKYGSFPDDYCLDSAQKQIVVQGVTADFNIDPASQPPTFNFTNASVPTNANYKWDFGQPAAGSSNNSTDKNPSHTYGNDTGRYLVCLITALPMGCADTVCKWVVNDKVNAFQVYNVFTPGTIDGKNDDYDVQLEGEDTYLLQIYNRWGVLVFEGNEDGNATNKKNWNGQLHNNGDDCPAGTYYYILKYTLKANPSETKLVSGTILLIR